MQDNQENDIQINVQEHNDNNSLPSNLELLNGDNGVLKEDNISNVFKYLLNKANPSNIKIVIINTIINAIQNNRMLCESFAYVNRCSIYIHLIDLFELEEDNTELKEAIENLITLLIKNITLHKDVYERVFKYCRKSYSNPKATKENISDCLSLVKLFYPTVNASQIKPKNYFAFYDPTNEGIIVDYKQYEILNGINFILSFKLQNAHSQREINLISLTFTNQKFKPININITPNENNAQLTLDPEIFNISDDDDNTIINLEYNTYYILTFVIHPINNSLCVFVNDSQENYEYFFKQNYFESKSIDTSISKMVFFKHFYGEVTSIINIRKCLIRTKLWTKRLNENMNMFIEGLCNKKQLTNFLKIIESEDNNTINDIVNMNINMFLKGEEMINFIFVPFNNDITSSQIKDVFSRGYAKYKNGIRVHTYKRMFRYVTNIGGAWNLVPLFEMICFYYINNYNNINNEKENELILKFLDIVNNIIDNNKDNIIELFSSEFFEVVALFITQSKTKILINDALMNKLLLIGKNMFVNSSIINKMSNKESMIVKKCLVDNKSDEKSLFQKYEKSFYSSFIFNEDILKFLPPSTILHLLKSIDEQLLSNVLKNSMILFLVNYLNPINIFCCEKHKNEFKKEFILNSKVIPKNEYDILQETLNIISKIIKQKINNSETDIDKTSKIFQTILNILSYSLTPCFQIVFLKLIHTELTNKTHSVEWISSTIEAIIDYNLPIILGNVLYLGSINVRKEVVKLIQTFYDNIFNNNNIPEQICNKFNSFLYAIKNSYLCDDMYFLESKELKVNKETITNIAKHCVMQLKSQQKQIKQCLQYSGNILAFKNELYEQYIKDLYYQFSLMIFNSDDDFEENQNETNYKQFNYNILITLIIISTQSNQVSILIDFLNKINEQLNCKFKDYDTLLSSKQFLKFLFDLTFTRSSFNKTPPQNETNEQSKQIYQLSKQIYLNLIREGINYYNSNPRPNNKHNTFYPIDSVETLLKWGNIMLLTSSTRQETLFGFITKYLIDISIEISNVIQQENFIKPNAKTNFYNDNYFRFVNFSYYYYAYYKLDSGIIYNTNSFVESRCVSDSIFNKNNIISGMKLRFSETKPTLSIVDIWQDYHIFHDFYYRVNKIWSDHNTLNTFHGETSTQNIYKLVKKYCIEKKKPNSYLNELIFICNVRNNMYKVNGSKISLLIILINTFPMILIIIDTIVKSENEFNLWFTEYHNFLLFIIMAINNLDQNCDELMSIHDNCLDAIVFSITFLAKFKPETQGLQDKVDQLLIKVFKYIFMFLKKTKVEIVPHVIVKNCFVKIFYSYFIGMTPKLIQEMEENDYQGVLSVVNGELFEKQFFKNEKLKKRMNLSINTWNNYASIVNQRYSSNQELNLSLDLSFKSNLSVIMHQKEIQTRLNKRDLLSTEKTKMLFKLIMKRYQRLFFFEQFWSDKSLFYGGVNSKYVKYKVVNHLCEDYSKPFIKPFIDIKNTLPTFLLNDVNQMYNYQSNVDEYYDFNLENKFIQANQNNNDDKSLIKNYSVTFIVNHLIFKARDHFLIEYHTILNNTLNKKLLNNIELDSRINDIEHHIMFPCCLIKLTYHIKGVMIINKNNQTITFYAKLSSNPCIKRKNNSQTNTPNTLCVGSIFETPLKISPIKSITIPYIKIHLLLRYTYYYKRTGISLLTQNNKHYVFNFHNEIDRENVIKEITSSQHFNQILNDFIDVSKCPKMNFDKDSGVILGYFNKEWNKHDNNSYKLSKSKLRIKLNKILKKWKSHKMSNYKLLMLLNFFGNRSYVDITQYPVFPWIFKSLVDSENIDIPFTNNIVNTNLYRNFSLPVGMFPRSKGAGLVSQINVDGFDYNYGTHYSNQIYLSYYLLRLYPFYSLNLELNEKHMDTEQRLFSSVGHSFEILTTTKGDVRELIPEFFTCPEMFQNVNNFHFTNPHMSNVQTPFDSNRYEFTSVQRRGLESIEVSNNIFKWIDLIFGYKQKGKEGLKAKNVFLKAMYFEDIDITKETNVPLLYTQLDFGLVPAQLFPKEVNGKYIKKIKESNKSECFMYINNENNNNNHNNNNVFYVSTSVDKGFEINAFTVFDNCQYNLPRNAAYRKATIINNSSLPLNKPTSKTVISKEININNNRKKENNDITNEEQSLFTTPHIYERIIYTLSILNNNYLYITSICIHQKDASYCKANIIKKTNITKGIALCKMENTNSLSYNCISFSDKCTDIIISGFNDRKIIIVSLFLSDNKHDIESESNIIYSKSFTSPLTTSCQFKYWKNIYVLIGDQSGNVFVFFKQLAQYILLRVTHAHLQEVTHITYNANIKCVATSSKDGVINLYLVPSFALLNSFKIQTTNMINKVFLFHTPLYCFVAYCQKNNTLTCHSMNIEQVLYEYEPDNNQSLEVKCPVVIEKDHANEYLAFVNETNEIIVLGIPKLNVVKKKQINFEVFALEYSKAENFLVAVDKTLKNIACVDIWK